MLTAAFDIVAQGCSALMSNVSILILAAFAYYCWFSYFQSGLNRYPGPLLAKFGKLWHRFDIGSNKHPYTLIHLHEKNGSIVRIGPTTLSISDPDYIPKIYGVSTGYLKSNMYDIFSPVVNGKVVDSLLSVRNPHRHSRLSKPVAKEFAMGVISEYEPLMDKTLRKWIQCLNQRSVDKDDQVCDMAMWTRMFATEAIMDMTFSESMGFLDAGDDVGGFLKALDKNIDASGLLCPMPWTAYIVRHNPIFAKLRKNNTMFPQWAAKRIQARIAARGNDSKPPVDFLDRFLDAGRTKSDDYDFIFVLNWCLVNIFAGGDTTATELAAIIYFLLKNPKKHEKLAEELRNPLLPSIFSWKDCQTLPYLDACIREGLRLHPSIALGFERDVGGLQLSDGYVLPQNVKVSMNPFVVNRQPSIFGDQVHDFVPERWLQHSQESDEDYRQRNTKMKKTIMNFGSGSRACTGKNIAMMEMYKAIAALIRNFDVTLVDPNEEWVQMNRWQSIVENVRCRLKKVDV